MALPWISACHGELIFWWSDASASWTSMSEWSCQYCDIYAWNTCGLLHRYPYMTGTLQVHGTCFHSYILHFLSYHAVRHKLVAMTYGRPICMYVSTCLHMYVCMCVPAMPPVFTWTGFESLFAYSCEYQIHNMVLCMDCQVQHYSILIVLC